MKRLFCRIFGHRDRLTLMPHYREFIPALSEMPLNTIKATPALLKVYECGRCGRIRRDPLADIIERAIAGGADDVTDLRR